MFKKLLLIAILVLSVQSVQASRHDPAETDPTQTDSKKLNPPPRPANIECMKDTADNQRKASQYILGLMANSKNIVRPTLKQNDACVSEIAYNEIITILDRAERMAQSGAANQITEPDFRFNGNEVDGEW